MSSLLLNKKETLNIYNGAHDIEKVMLKIQVSGDFAPSSESTNIYITS